MGFSTIYDVKVRYGVDDRAGRAVTSLANNTRALRNEVTSTRSAFLSLGGAVAGYFGAREAGKALIGFNARVETTKVQIAGMLALAKKTDLADQAKTADAMYARLQKRAMTLPGTTQEYVDMAGKLTRVVIDSGGTVKDIEDMTVGATVAAKGLGEQWEVAARDIEQALMGRYNTTDPFSSKVLGSIGYKGEEGREKWRLLSEEKRLLEMKRGLGQKQFEQMGEASGATFSGVLSTLQDNFEQIVGKVGLPLFKAITEEVKSWNSWLDANKERVDEIAKTLGEGLVKGFTIVKDALGFLVRNADTLIALGKVWAITKIGGMLGGGISSLAGGAAGLGGKMGWFRGARDSFDAAGNYSFSPAGAGRSPVGGFGGAMSNLPLLGQAAGAGFALGTLINNATGLSHALSGSVELHGQLYDATDKTTQQFIRLVRGSDVLEAAMKRAAAAANGDSSTGISNAIAQSNVFGMQKFAIEKYLRQQAKGGADYSLPLMNAGMDFIGKQMGLGDRDTVANLGNAAKLEQLGLDPKLVGQEMANALAAKQNEIEASATGAQMLGKTSMAIGISQLTDYQRQTLDVAQAQEKILNYMYGQLANGIPFNQDDVMKMLRESTNDPNGTHKAIGAKPNVNVTIQHIEVQSDDPDRFAFGLVESFRDMAKNPSSALSALREG